jgi:hypothetical protein
MKSLGFFIKKKHDKRTCILSPINPLPHFKINKKGTKLFDDTLKSSRIASVRSKIHRVLKTYKMYYYTFHLILKDLDFLKHNSIYFYKKTKEEPLIILLHLFEQS